MATTQGSSFETFPSPSRPITPFDTNEPQMQEPVQPQTQEPVQPQPYQPYAPYPPELFTFPQRREETGKEKSFNKPTPFTGDRKKVEIFIQECSMYLHANRKIYIDEEDKIMFMLSFMNDKEALRWKQTYIRSITNQRRQMVFPTYDQFVDELINYFQPANVHQEAAHQLSILRQGKKTAEEIVTEFRLLTSQAGYSVETPTDHMHLIEKFRRTLNPSLTKKIMMTPPVPTTIDGWVNQAILLDSMYRHTMETMNIDEKTRNDKRTPSKSGGTNYSDHKKKHYNNKKDNDDDAMDIDRLSPEKRTILMKKGACFICEKPGHLARDHDEHEKKEKGKWRASTR
jgi:hypothetical protein